MTPKSKSDIRELLDTDNNLVNRVKYIMDNDLQYLYTEEELKELIERAIEFMTFAEQSTFAIRYCFVWIVEDILKEGYYDYPSIAETALNDVRTINSADEEFEFEGYEERVKIRNKIAELIKERNKRFKKKDIKLIESVRDLMTPKSKEDIERSLNTLPLVRDRLLIADRLGIKYDIMKNSYSVSANEFLKLSVERHLLDGVKEAVLRGSHKSYALRLCAEHGFYDGVKWLLENGANPYANDSEAFKMAENNPSIRSLMKQYRKNSVPYNESLRDKMTPKSEEDIKRDLDKLSPDRKLNKGINAELPWLVEDALKKGANPNLTYPGSSYPEGFTCLMKVILTNCNLDIIKLLVEHGADVKAKTKNGSTVLGILKAQMGTYDSYRYKLAYDFIKSEVDKMKKQVSESIKDLMTPKPKEELRKSMDKLPLLKRLDMSKNLDIYSDEEIQEMINKSTPNERLELGYRTSRWELVRQAIEDGANIHHNGDSALREACWDGKLDMVKFLVDKGAKVSIHEDDALMGAAHEGHLEIVKYLISKGADIHAGGIEKVLRSACHGGHTEVVKYLLEQGAEANQIKNQDITTSKMHERGEIMDLLKKYWKYKQ